MTGLSVYQLALAALVLLAAAYVLIGSVFLIPGKKDVARDLFQAILSMTIVAGTLMAVFVIGDWALVPFFLLLAARTGFEAAAIRFDTKQALIAAGISAICTASVLIWPMLTYGVLGVWCLLFARIVAVPGAKDTSIWKWSELFVYPILPMALLAWAGMDDTLRPLMLVAYILIETFDSYAYVAGKLVGRTKAFPVLSPRKTVEGLLGGAVILMLTAAIVAAFADMPIVTAMTLALITGALGVIGDLAASRLKRAAGVKDFPIVLPKQGGLLDIADSWIAGGGGLAALFLVWTMV